VFGVEKAFIAVLLTELWCKCMPKPVSEFKSVSLSKPLYNLILKFIEEHPEYRSIADFVSESVRVRMQELGQGASEHAGQ
jgi:hypothetical protein